MKILIGVTGSVAAIKVPELVKVLKSNFEDVEIKLVVTSHSKHFFSSTSIQKEVVSLHDDNDEWNTWNKIGDPILHIELRRWADLLVIAPLDANTLAKLANGICDNLLTSTIRAWDCSKPLLYCLAMNTSMWEHPLTNKHRDVLKELGYIEVPCVSKTLACGDTGMGAMASVSTIVNAVKYSIQK